MHTICSAFALVLRILLANTEVKDIVFGVFTNIGSRRA